MNISTLMCAIFSGHQHMPVWEDGRMFLRCICGHETPGWQVDLRAFSPRDLEQVYHDMLEVEYQLHGGG